MEGSKQSLLERIRSHTIKSTSAYGDVFIFVLFILVFTVARFIGILVHEVGHGLVAIALGGDFFAMYASPGTGLSYVYTENLSWNQRIFVDLGGVMSQAILGVILFIVYLRFRGFLTRIFTLQLLVVLLVYPFLYLGLSVFYSGDGFLIVEEIKTYTQFDSSIVLVVASLSLASIAGYFITRRVFAFINEYFPLFTKQDKFLTLFLFFSIPLVVGFIGAIAAISIIPLKDIQFFIAFLITANILFFFASYLVLRKVGVEKGAPKVKKIKWISAKESVTILASFTIVTVIWLAAFGPTPSTAYGVVLKEPPIGSEKNFADVTVLNIDIELSPDEAEVSLKLRGAMMQSSPLERTMWHSFDDRAHWPYYESISQFILTMMFKATDWNIVSESIGPAVYGYDTTFQHARLIKLRTTSVDDIFVNISGTHRLTMYDPWLNERTRATYNHISYLNISWSQEFSLEDYYTEPAWAPSSDLSTYLEWTIENREVAPSIYTIEFTRI